MCVYIFFSSMLLNFRFWEGTAPMSLWDPIRDSQPWAKPGTEELQVCEYILQDIVMLNLELCLFPSASFDKGYWLMEKLFHLFCYREREVTPFETYFLLQKMSLRTRRGAPFFKKGQNPVPLVHLFTTVDRKKTCIWSLQNWDLNLMWVLFRIVFFLRLISITKLGLIHSFYNVSSVQESWGRRWSKWK